MTLGGALGLAWSPVTPVTTRHFAWQAWHNLRSTIVSRGRRGTHGTGWRAWTGLVARDARDAAALCVAGVAQSRIHHRFAWQAWHLLRSAAMPESDWPEYRLVNGFEYHFGDISEWPNDMVRVHPVDRTETVICFLGSLAALRCLRDTKEVHVVISLCTSEMQRIRGQPEEGWAAFLIGMSVEHVTIDLDDPRTKWPGEDYFCEEMGNCYFAAWQNICIKIGRSLLGRGDNLSTGLLFHCFGGINRSSAALAAWLIFKHAMNADDAIDVLLKAHPTLNPWVKRPHILWALKTWEKRRLSVCDIVERALSEMTPTSKRSKCSVSV